FRGGREIRPFRTPQANVEHVHAHVLEPTLEGGGELRTREANVVAHRDAAGLHKGRIGASDVVGDGLVDLIRNAATDIVGFEGVQIGHDRSLQPRILRAILYAVHAPPTPWPTGGCMRGCTKIQANPYDRSELGKEETATSK